jgi:PAS domain S-box-containing protein
MEARVLAPTEFLADGGEMGELIRSYNWAQTSLGSIENWPMSLKTTISLILRSPYPMFIWWGRELIMFHNDAYVPVLGKKHPEALGKSAKEMWAEIWPEIGPLADEVFNGGRIYHKDLPLYLSRKAYLEETYWTFSYSPVPNDNGQIGGLFCACNEETEKILGQRRLNILQKIAVLSMQNETVDEVSRAIVQVIAANRNDVPFCFLYLLNDKKDVQLAGYAGMHANKLQNISDDIWQLQNSKNTQAVFTNQLPPQIQKHIPEVHTASIVPLQKGSDEKTGYLICGISPSLELNEDYKNFLIYTAAQVSTAITDVRAFELERQRAETLHQLAFSKHKAQQELHNLFMQAPVGIIILKGDNHIVELVNEFYTMIVQRTESNLLGQSVFDVIPEAVGQGFREILNGVRLSGEPLYLHEHKTLLNRNGREDTIYVSFVFQPLKELDGSIEKVMVLVHDVSEQVIARKKMEDVNYFLEKEVNKRTNALKQANAELERSNKELEQFAYAASHDMQEPLRKIQTFASFLTDDTENITEAQQKYIGKIQESAKRMSGIIEDLLNYSHQTSEIQFIQTDLNAIVQDVIFDLELLINQKSAIITHDNLPVIRTIAGQMHQLFYNLVNNALKFSKEDVPARIHISATMLDNGRCVEITVRDNGIGFEPEYADKIFQLFKRLNDRKSYSGSGIGLALCKKIVSNHNGSITAQSQPGDGASFIIRLPVEQS